MYDASAKNKTQKKIYFEPIENIMFNYFVLIVFVETKYTY